jgi:hypothetical protein
MWQLRKAPPSQADHGAPARRCPICGARLTYRDIKLVGSFPCAACHTQLQAQEFYAPLAFWGSILLVSCLLAAVGFRGLALLGVAALAAYPAAYVGVNCIKYLIPPKVEVYLPKHADLDLRDTRKPTETHETKHRIP